MMEHNEAPDMLTLATMRRPGHHLESQWGGRFWQSEVQENRRARKTSIPTKTGESRATLSDLHQKDLDVLTLTPVCTCIDILNGPQRSIEESMRDKQPWSTSRDAMLSSIYVHRLSNLYRPSLSHARNILQCVDLGGGHHRCRHICRRTQHRLSPTSTQCPRNGVLVPCVTFLSGRDDLKRQHTGEVIAELSHTRQASGRIAAVALALR